LSASEGRADNRISGKYRQRALGCAGTFAIRGRPDRQYRMGRPLGGRGKQVDKDPAAS